MSSPVGHSLAGWAIGALWYKSIKPVSFKVTALCMFVANAPDLDFLPGALVGKPNLYHHGLSHSLGAAVIFASLGTLLLRLKKGKEAWSLFPLMIFLYGSHLLLDLISIDGRPPLGIPIFWPLTERYFMIPILPAVKHSALDYATTGQVLTDIFSMHNLYVIGFEILLMIPLALVVMWWSRKRRPPAAENWF